MWKLKWLKKRLLLKSAEFIQNYLTLAMFPCNLKTTKKDHNQELYSSRPPPVVKWQKDSTTTYSKRQCTYQTKMFCGRAGAIPGALTHYSDGRQTC